MIKCISYGRSKYVNDMMGNGMMGTNVGLAVDRVKSSSEKIDNTIYHELYQLSSITRETRRNGTDEMIGPGYTR
jgi:hypothetical protein